MQGKEQLSTPRDNNNILTTDHEVASEVDCFKLSSRNKNETIISESIEHANLSAKGPVYPDTGTGKKTVGQSGGPFDKVVLNPDSTHSTVFFALITVFSIFSTTFSAYFACFGEPVLTGVLVFDDIMEVFFALDIIRMFLTQYVDP